MFRKIFFGSCFVLYAVKCIHFAIQWSSEIWRIKLWKNWLQWMSNYLYLMKIDSYHGSLKNLLMYWIIYTIFQMRIIFIFIFDSRLISFLKFLILLHQSYFNTSHKIIGNHSITRHALKPRPFCRKHVVNGGRLIQGISILAFCKVSRHWTLNVLQTISIYVAKPQFKLFGSYDISIF